MGKLGEPNEDIIIHKQKIDRFTLKKSKSHIPSIELDDDDEGDIARPSGAAPSGVSHSIVERSHVGLSGDDPHDEEEIHALNEHLDRLQVRLDRLRRD
ncbi:hypothetical protein MRB53_032907 [Persea americana]|uniref:Uncharacterized protein n=1 Tax=Persea americana TaxID=3435 RepID=A0ACC2KU85_PERAE|nr:hypothetical protein MRB53_032907 [Persea americana]